MSSLVALRAAIAEGLADELADVPASVGPVTVATHEGEFDLDTLKRCAASAPAVIVAFDRVVTEVVGGVVSATVYTVITIVTKDRAAVRRDVAALHLVKEVLRVLAPKCWDVEGSKRGFNFQARNWYSEKVAACGVCLWTVMYTQNVDLLPESESLDDFITFYGKWDLAPTDGYEEAEDEISLAAEFDAAFDSSFAIVRDYV